MCQASGRLRDYACCCYRQGLGFSAPAGQNICIPLCLEPNTGRIVTRVERDLAGLWTWRVHYRSFVMRMQIPSPENVLAKS